MMPITDDDRKRRQGKTILVVDDDPQIISFIELVLKHAGFTVVSAANGHECLTVLARVRPVTILLDVELGRSMDGYETCALIRKSFPDLSTPIIFVTARKTEKDVKRALAVGGDSFLTKPLNPDKLVERVVYCLGRPRIAPSRSE